MIRENLPMKAIRAHDIEVIAKLAERHNACHPLLAGEEHLKEAINAFPPITPEHVEFCGALNKLAQEARYELIAVLQCGRRTLGEVSFEKVLVNIKLNVDGDGVHYLLGRIRSLPDNLRGGLRILREAV